MVLSFIVASRFFGLFIVLPVLSLYGTRLDGANDVLVGLIVGIYAIFQIIFSTPFGYLSDKIGRKKTMFFGLLIFIIGCIICANASDIYTMLFGRILQGSGAVGGVASAMIADFVKEEERGKAMAIMGGMIGMSFALAIVISPFVAKFFGLSGIFYLSGILSVLCILLLFVLPKESAIKSYKPASKKDAFKNKDLIFMYITNMLQKMIISATFVAIPLRYVNEFLHDEKDIYILYSVCMFFGFLAMGIGGVFGEKKGFSKHILLAGVLLFLIENILFIVQDFNVFMIGCFVFFIGFCLHEPIMQSSVSKICKVEQKGLVLGIFNSFGYFGSFFGALLIGLFLHSKWFYEFYILMAVLCLAWFIMLCFLNNPNIFKNIYLDKDVDVANIALKNGIVECYLSHNKTIIKYNSKLISKEEILNYIKD